MLQWSVLTASSGGKYSAVKPLCVVTIASSAKFDLLKF